jgi:Na+/H+-dicarboxylate symporter
VLVTIGVNPALIAIILGVDRILDMCRTTLNVTGDITARRTSRVRKVTNFCAARAGDRARGRADATAVWINALVTATLQSAHTRRKLACE